MKKVFGTGWNIDNVTSYVEQMGAEAMEDNDGQILLCTNLYGSLAGELFEAEDSDFDDDGNFEPRYPS